MNIPKRDHRDFALENAGARIHNLERELAQTKSHLDTFRDMVSELLPLVDSLTQKNSRLTFALRELNSSPRELVKDAA